MASILEAGKRFGSVRFIRVKNEEQLASSLANIWIGSYNLFASVARFNRQERKEVLLKKVVEKTNNVLPTQKVEQEGSTQHKKSYASTLHGDGESKVDRQEPKKKQLTLSDQELVHISDSQAVAFVKVKNVETINSLYRLYIESDKEKKAESESDEEEDIQEAVFNSKVSNDTSKDQEENSYINADNVVSKEETPEFQTERMERSNSSDESRPQGFKHFKNSEKEPPLSSLQSKSGKCINDAGLLELPLGGRNFTWMNKVGTKMSRLDRYPISQHVTYIFPDVKVSALPRGWSDHTPIMLHCNKVDFGPIPFKFFHSWLQRDGFDDCIKKAYNECSLINPQMSFHEKIKCLKQNIRDWNRKSISIKVSRKQEVMRKIIDIEDKIDSNTASDIDKEERMKLLKEHDDIQQLEDMDLIQKARTLKVIDKVVSNEQSAFISGRYILDGPLMLSETMSWYKKKKRNMLLFKVDFKKPLTLSTHRFKNAVSSGLIQRASIEESGFKLSHFFYADDVVIISYWNMQDMNNIVHVLNVFYLTLGLKINVSKSNVYGLGVDQQDIEAMARDIGYQK
ncbi:RNA-directed DNA polymerase, eukaryota, reverse transcriptase zinc-binding domain protein [Tanacetum coccineum]